MNKDTIHTAEDREGQAYTVETSIENPTTELFVFTTTQLGAFIETTQVKALRDALTGWLRANGHEAKPGRKPKEVASA